MVEFPFMLFKAPGPEQIHGGNFSTVIANNQEQYDTFKAEGWHDSTPEAKQAFESAQAEQARGNEPADDNAPATREELEQKATELGISFSARTSDRKLRDLISATLEE